MDSCSLPLEPYSLCSAPLAGHIGDNLLQFRPNLAEEGECFFACAALESCRYYLHFNLTDPSNPASCFLLSGLQEPLEPCDHCRTGASNCSNACSLQQEPGAPTPGLLLSTPGTVTVQVIALGSCPPLTALVVGGGGKGYNGGGGSGYIIAENLTVERSITVEVRVGGPREESSVTLGSRVVRAGPGEDGCDGSSYWGGGAGYRGGGGVGFSKGGDGGTDGGAGEAGSGSSYHGPGGAGSGVEVAGIPVRGFLLRWAGPPSPAPDPARGGRRPATPMEAGAGGASGSGRGLAGGTRVLGRASGAAGMLVTAARGPSSSPSCRLSLQGGEDAPHWTLDPTDRQSDTGQDSTEYRVWSQCIVVQSTEYRL
jgi:hypothetical protein